MSTIEAIELFKKERLQFGNGRHIEAANSLSRISRSEFESIERAVRNRLHEQSEQRDLPLTGEPNADRAA